jgi:adenine-specific DNA methylase
MKGAMNWDWTSINAALAVVARQGYHQDVENLYRLLRYFRAALMDHDAACARSAEHDIVMLAASILARQA